MRSNRNGPIGIPEPVGLPAAKRIRRRSAVRIRMPGEVTLAEAGRLTILSWRVDDGGLVLRFGADDERALRCRCGRAHWIIETHHDGGRAILAVKCHGCGTQQVLRLAASPLAPR